MTIGSVLLQPQALSRFESFDYDNALVDDALAIAQKLLQNPEWTESLLAELAEALQDFAQVVVTDLSANTDQGIAALAEFVQPYIEAIQAFAGTNPRFETVGDILSLITTLVNKLADILEALTLDNIRDFIARLFTIIFTRFGLSIDYLQELVAHAVDRAIEVLENHPEGAAADYIAVRQELRQLLLRVKREILVNLPVIDLSAELIARQVIQSLRANGLELFREKAACFVDKIAAVFDAATSLLEIANVAFGRNTVGAAHVSPIQKGKTYCWYASWLYAIQKRDVEGKTRDFILPLYTPDEVWISEDGKKLILRRVAEDQDLCLYESTSEINWWDAPQFNGTGPDENFSFNFNNTLSPQFLEEWTKATSIILYMWKTFGHLVSGVSEPKNHATHLLLAGWNLTRVVGSAATQAPFTSWLRDEMGWRTGKRVWIDMFFQWSSVVFGSIEGRHSETNVGNQFLVWFTLLGDDALDSFFLHEVGTVVNEGMLSIFTLMNNTQTGYIAWDDTSAPKNREYVYPLVNLSVIFWGYILNKHVIPIKEYSHPFEGRNAADYHKWWWGAAPAFGALAGVTGELIGAAFSRSFSFKSLLIQLGTGAFKGWGTHVVQNYYWKEGDTNDGRYNESTIAGLAEFDGYPDHATSPYRLPVPAGQSTFVGQANQGMFSHFWNFGGNVLPQIYAYDFSHDFGETIVAVRSGTVVDYFDWIADDIQPNNTQIATAVTASAGSTAAGQSGTVTANANGDQNPSWNFILVRHDDPFGDETVDEKAHDVGAGGVTGTSYAVYGHGANSGVRDAFDEKVPSIAATAIIGQTVRQGEAIMKAGDTGVSFHNHLHLHIRIDENSSLDVLDGSGNLPSIINSSQLDFYTIPFVFRDARHPFKPNGRLYNLTWYKSNNVEPD